MYDIKTSVVKSSRVLYCSWFFIGIIFSIAVIVMYSSFKEKYYLFFLIIPILIMIYTAYKISIVNKRLRTVKKLINKGRLVKNIPYRLELTKEVSNIGKVFKPVVDFALPSGKIVTLYGDTRHDDQLNDEDGLIDLVIDEENPSVYFLDYEINRIGGNKPSDYYQKTPNPKGYYYDEDFYINKKYE